MRRCLFFVFLIIQSINVYAFSVDSLFKIDKDGENFFILKNTTGSTEFVSIRLSSISIVNGEIVETPFNNEEFFKWPLYASPSTIILDPNGSERVDLIKIVKEHQSDLMLGITLMPDRLSELNNSVDIAIGYKSWYLIPGSEKMDGNLIASRDKNNLLLNNNTNKHITMTIEQCDTNTTDKAIDNNTEECTSSLFMLSGTEKIIKLKNEKKVIINYFDALKINKKKIEL